MTDKPQSAGLDLARLRALAEASLEAEAAHARLKEQAVPNANIELYYSLGDFNKKKLEAKAAYYAATSEAIILSLLTRLESLELENAALRETAAETLRTLDAQGVIDESLEELRLALDPQPEDKNE